jgi:hypothetical protein
MESSEFDNLKASLDSLHGKCYGLESDIEDFQYKDLEGTKYTQELLGDIKTQLQVIERDQREQGSRIDFVTYLVLAAWIVTLTVLLIKKFF